MGKIVGNFFLIFLSVASFIANNALAEITLSIVNEDRAALTQVAVGRPFILEVKVSDAHAVGTAPEIKGTENIVLKNRGVQITSINGKTSAKYSYQARIDTQGDYTFGPAILDDRDDYSNQVKITVGSQEVEQKKEHSKKKDNTVVLRLHPDKQRVFEGERVTCTLRFYYTNPAIRLRQFIEQELNDFERKKARGPFYGNETLNGIDYNYVEWLWDIYPQKSGQLLIPAYGADYERELEREDFWGGLGRFLGNHVETKRVYSNASTITVDPIDQTGESKAVGLFRDLHVTASPRIAKEGEGMVVTVQIKGDGDPDKVTIDTLYDLPSELKFYESNHKIIAPKAADGLYTKKFEFIVQGLKSGTYEIPPQKFNFFNTQERELQTLKSEPLQITILPVTAQKYNFTNQSDFDDDDNEIKAMHKEGWSPVANNLLVPWWLFFIFTVAPLCFVFWQNISAQYKKKNRGSYLQHRCKNAFKNAKKQLKNCKKADQLYRIFIEFFSDRWNMPLAAISPKKIEEMLTKKGFSGNDVEKWNIYFNTLSEVAFGAKKDDETTTLFDQAKLWINKFETKL